MNNNETPIDMLFEKADNYSKTTIELLKLKAIDKTTTVMASITAKFLLAIVVTLFTLVSTIGFSLWIGDLMGKSYYGFLFVAGIYFFVIVLLYTFQNKWIKLLTKNYFISEFLN
jgi:hypothetical protein